MQVSPSVHGSKPRAGKRQRRIGMTMLVAGIIVLVAAFAPTSANAVIANSSLVPQGPSKFNEDCVGVGDPASTLIPQLFPNGLILPGQITTNAINSPSDGENFTLSVTWQTTLPVDLIMLTQSLGTTSLDVSNSTLPLSATSGATGTATTVDPGPTTVNLPGPSDPAIAVQFTQGPFDVSFTRSGTGPVVLTPGTVLSTSTANGIGLNLSCTPTGVTPLTLTDVAGPPPPSTTVTVSTLPPSPPTTAARVTTAATKAASTGPVTSGTALARTGGFHAELLYLGIALLGAGYALSLAGRRVARASSRSS